MTTLRHEIRIEAPVAQVWETLADLTAVQHYNPMVKSARHVRELTGGVGASRRCELLPRGWVEERVWEWHPPHVIGLEVVASDWPLVCMKWTTRLAAKGAATRVTQEMEYRLRFGPLGALLDALVLRRRIDRGVAEVFRGLKQYTENKVSSRRP